MNRDLVVRELLAAARELLGYERDMKKRRPQHGEEKRTDKIYYRQNKRDIKKQQKLYRKRNKAPLKRQRDRRRKLET